MPTDSERLDFVLNWLSFNDQLNCVRDWTDNDDAREAIDAAMRAAEEARLRRATNRGMSKGLSPAEYRCWLALWKHLSDEQKQKVRHKAEWEHVTLLGVFWDWPSLFGEEGEALHRAFSDE